MNRLDTLIAETSKSGSASIDGGDAFRLHDTYGFPIDLTIELASAAGLQVELDGFRTALNEQRARSRTNLDAFADAMRQRAPLYAALGSGSSVFVGYERESAQTRVAALLGGESAVDTIEAGDTAELVLAETPFYAESGGQVGDTGEIVTDTGRFVVSDTQRPAPGVVVHIGEVVEGFIQQGQAAGAAIDSQRRADVRRNHTATHLLHEALREVLGEGTQQAGSLVAPERLRFDFTSQVALGDEGIDAVARIANQQVITNHPVAIRQEPYDEAVARGATALFGEKYGDVVRTVEVPGYSLELCGGTHVRETGEIGPIVVLSESSIGSGVRRIEAITGREALAYLETIHRQTRSLARDLRTTPDSVAGAVTTLQEALRDRDRQIERLRVQLATSDVDSIASNALEVDGTRVIAARVDVGDRDTLLQVGDRLRDRLQSGVVVLASPMNGQPALIAMVTRDLVERGAHAGRIIQEIAPLVGGRGGGRPEVAQGGGTDSARIDEALAAVEAAVRRQVTR
jgi:alanyl-tRNA synthetase